jgi:circadian clock protein KaiB
MSRSRKLGNAPDAAAAATTVIVMRLYIAGSAPNSVQAIANLEAICREHLTGAHKLEIVDILEYPLRAIADGVVVTPSLTKVSPLPASNIVGNLSDKSKVLLALGLKGKVA